MNPLWVDAPSVISATSLSKQLLRVYIYAAEGRNTSYYEDEVHRQLYRRMLQYATNDWKSANVFFIPTWHILSYSSFQTHPAFLNSKMRNHFLLHVHTDAALCFLRYKNLLSSHLLSRVVFLEYGGRFCHQNPFCNYHFQREECYDEGKTIVIPAVVPLHMNRYYKSRLLRNAFMAMDMDYEQAVSYFQHERAYVVKYLEMFRLQISRQISNYTFLMKFIERTPGKYNTILGAHMPGFGVWSARLYAYILAGVVPVLFTDGVILPFERVINYEAFSIKIKMTRVITHDYSPFLQMQHLELRRYHNSFDNTYKDWFDKAILSTQEVAPWLDWRSSDAIRNPFSLIVLEIMCRIHRHMHEMCQRSTFRIANREFWPRD
jgi:hypothetical protein